MLSQDDAGDFHDVHLHPLQSQGSVYTLCHLLSENEGSTERRAHILASTLNRRSFALQCMSSGTQPRISSKEIHFTYIPSGAEIISIDAFRRHDLKDYVVGITIIIKSSSTAETGATNSNAGGQFFNIYNDDLPLEESLAHNCQSLELDFIPYQLTHAPIQGPQGSVVWLLSGSDSHIHPYAYEPQGQVYNRIPLSDCFPELEEECKIRPLSIIQWLDITYYHCERQQNALIRLTATGREDGRLRVTQWNMESNVLLASWTKETMEDPITALRFFHSTIQEKVPKGFEDYLHRSQTNPDVNLVVVYALSDSKVFKSIHESGLEVVENLKNSHCYDVPTSVLVVDVNFDGKTEILLGTYGQVLLCYGQHGPEWVRQKLSLSSRRFPAPILNLDYIDLSGDGIRDLVVMTTKGLHILQFDRINVIKVMKKRLLSIFNNTSKI